MWNHVLLDENKMKGMYSQMKEELPILKEPRDAWVKKMMQWHFSEKTGSPFWLLRKKELGFDPLEEVNTYEDMKKFGLFEKQSLNSVPTGDLVPKGFKDRPRRIFETGGTTGDPLRIVDVTTGSHNLAMYGAMLKARGLWGGDILAMTPSGPHAYGTFVSRLGACWNGNVFFIDFDPRWVKKLLRQHKAGEAYLQHLIDQTLVLLKSQQPKFLFTTSKLLLELAAHLDRPLSEYGVRAVCTGGTSCTREEARYLFENVLEGVQWIDTYGNTLMGHALQGDPWENNPARSYYLPPPLGFIEVVNPENWQQRVETGHRGRVLLVTLLEDLFIPNLLERDSAIRVGPHPWFPWDGVSDVQPYRSGKDEVITEGVY